MNYGKILNRVQSSSICARHSLIQCKLVHHVYFTKARLAKIYEGVSPACDKCCQSPANLIHMFWLCPSLYNYWTNIFETVLFIIVERIEPNSLTALFGICPSVPSLSTLKQDAIAFVTLLARRLILLNWKSKMPPSHSRWLSDVLYFIKLEKIRFSLKKCSNKFWKLWGPLFQYIKESSSLLSPD